MLAPLRNTVLSTNVLVQCLTAMQETTDKASQRVSKWEIVVREVSLVKGLRKLKESNNQKKGNSNWQQDTIKSSKSDQSKVKSPSIAKTSKNTDIDGS